MNHVESTPAPFENMDSTLSRLYPSQIDTSTPSRNPSKVNVVPSTPSPKPPSSFSTLAKLPSSPILPEAKLPSSPILPGATHHASIITITNQQTTIPDELIITGDHTADHTAIEPPVERSIDAHIQTSEVEIADEMEPKGNETVVEIHGGDDPGTEVVLPQGDDNIGDKGSFVVVIPEDNQDTQTHPEVASETESSSGEEDVEMSKDSASSHEETNGKSEASVKSTQTGIPLSRVDADRRYTCWGSYCRRVWIFELR
jgi:hypothetical protein